MSFSHKPPALPEGLAEKLERFEAGPVGSPGEPLVIDLTKGAARPSAGDRLARALKNAPNVATPKVEPKAAAVAVTVGCTFTEAERMVAALPGASAGELADLAANDVAHGLAFGTTAERVRAGLADSGERPVAKVDDLVEVKFGSLPGVKTVATREELRPVLESMGATADEAAWWADALFARAERPLRVLDVAKGAPAPGVLETYGPEGPAQFVLQQPTEYTWLPPGGPGQELEPARPEPPRPWVGAVVWYTPPPSMAALHKAGRLDACDPRNEYPAPVVLAADVIKLEPTGEVSLYVKCPEHGPFGVHMALGPHPAPGTDAARGCWGWPVRP